MVHSQIYDRAIRLAEHEASIFKGPVLRVIRQDQPSNLTETIWATQPSSTINNLLPLRDRAYLLPVLFAAGIPVKTVPNILNGTH